MQWQDRITEAAYTASNGQRVTFTYEDVSVEVEKRGTLFEFPGTDGTYIQDAGRNGRKYPLRMILWGADHDAAAAQLVSALEQSGLGTLEHPFYGVKQVVVFGAIVRRDDLVTAANQTIIEATFWEAIADLYSGGALDAKSRAASASEDTYSQAIKEFARNLNLDSAIKRVSARNKYTALATKTVTALAPYAQNGGGFQAAAQALQGELLFSTFSPETVAAQYVAMFRLVSGAALSLYDSLVTESDDAVVQDNANVTAFSAQTYEATTRTYANRIEALKAAGQVQSTYERLVTIRDASLAEAGVTDSSEMHAALSESLAATLQYIIDEAANLPALHAVVTQRERTIIDLAYELGTTADALIVDNALTGSEILEIPRGRRIEYYV